MTSPVTQLSTSLYAQLASLIQAPETGQILVQTYNVRTRIRPEVSAEQGAHENSNGIITMGTNYQEAGGSFNSQSLRITGTVPGKRFLALIDSNFKNNNITWCNLMFALLGHPYPATPQYHINPIVGHKLDTVSIDHHLADIIGSLTSHAMVRNPDGSRNIYDDEFIITGIFV